MQLSKGDLVVLDPNSRGEAAKHRAAGKKLGDIGQGGAHQQQDQQLAAAEALLDLASQLLCRQNMVFKGQFFLNLTKF